MDTSNAPQDKGGSNDVIKARAIRALQQCNTDQKESVTNLAEMFVNTNKARSRALVVLLLTQVLRRELLKTVTGMVSQLAHRPAGIWGFAPLPLGALASEPETP